MWTLLIPQWGNVPLEGLCVFLLLLFKGEKQTGHIPFKEAPLRPVEQVNTGSPVLMTHHRWTSVCSVSHTHTRCVVLSTSRDWNIKVWRGFGGNNGLSDTHREKPLKGHLLVAATGNDLLWSCGRECATGGDQPAQCGFCVYERFPEDAV